MSEDRFLRLPQVMRITGLSRSVIRREELSGEFPARVRISKRAVGWRETDVRNWMANRQPAGGER